MSVTFASLGLDGLSAAEKLDLVAGLWDEAVAAIPTDFPSDARRQELRRRAADAAARPDDWVSWEEARDATLRRLGS